MICNVLLICVKSAFVKSESLDPFVTSDTLQAGGFAMITYSVVAEQRRVGPHFHFPLSQSGKSLLQPVSLVESNLG